MFCPHCGGKIPDELLKSKNTVANTVDATTEELSPAQMKPAKELRPSSTSPAPVISSPNTSKTIAASSNVKKPIVKGNMLTCPICMQPNISPEATECFRCKTKFISSPWKCSHCNSTNLYTTSHCNSCNSPFSKTLPEYTNDYLGKKWFHFLVYFSIFATAILNIISGLTTVTEAPIVALISIGIGIFYFFVRSFLVNFKTYGPSAYLWANGITRAISVISSIGELNELSEIMDSVSRRGSRYEMLEATYSTLEATTVIMVIVSVIMMMAEYVYFQKRASWFNQD